MYSPFLVPIVLFVSIAVVLFAFIQSRHRERMAMIEKGFDASLLQPGVRNRTGKFGALKVGIAAIGVGLGLLIGGVLARATTLDEPVAYFSMITLFGGVGLIIYYLLVRNKD